MTSTERTEALDHAWRRSGVIITIGGLGPTLDDLTRDAIAKMLGEEMSVAPELKTWLEENFSRRNIRPMPQSNLRQARMIPSATAILNAMGTAPSWWIERDGKILVTLPGPPRELTNMWTTEVGPRLKERLPGQAIVSRTFKTIGLSEAALDELVRHVYDIPGMDLGVYTKADGIHVRAIARAPAEAEAVQVLERAEAEIRGALGPYIWGAGEESPPEKIGELLRERNYTLAVVESCTGGMLGAAITDVPGSSDYFVGGAIAYSNDVKLIAGVPAEVIDGSGAVSAETAHAMAEAARTTYGADCGIGVTGVAGPGDTDGIKAGTVFIGVAVPGSTGVEPYAFPSRRPLVRGRAVTAALLQLTRALQQEEETS